MSSSGCKGGIGEAEDAHGFLFGLSSTNVTSEGELKVLKPEPIEVNELDQRYMYCQRVLEGDLPIVPHELLLWGPLWSLVL